MGDGSQLLWGPQRETESGSLIAFSVLGPARGCFLFGKLIRAQADRLAALCSEFTNHTLCLVSLDPELLR